MRNLIERFASEPLGNFTNNSASVIVGYLVSLRSSPAQLGSAARARRHRSSAKSLHSTDRQLERMEACLGRWLHPLSVGILRKYPGVLRALPRRFSQHRALAVLLPLRAWSRQWPIRHRLGWRSCRATPARDVLH